MDVYPVTGKVTFKGQQPVGATVVLHPVTGRRRTILPTGTVKSDGSFAITSYDPEDGAPQGEYVATIEWYKYEPKLGGVGPNVLPRKYASSKTSPIRVSVNAGAGELKPIAIR